MANTWQQLDLDGDGKTGTNKDKKAWNRLSPADQALYKAMLGSDVTADTSDPVIQIPSWLFGTTQETTIGSGDIFGWEPPKKVKGKTSANLSELADLPIVFASSKGGRQKLAQMSQLLFGRSDASLEDIGDAWYRALQISAITGKSVENTIKNPMFRSSIFGTTAPSGPRKNIVLTSRDEANQTLTQTMIEWLDRAPTKEEKDQFFKRLNTLQKKSPTISNVSGSTATTISGGVDAATFARKFVLKKLSPDQDLDGTLGVIQDNLMTLAERNGLVVSKQEMLGIMKKIAKGASFESYKAEFNERAATKYTALADALRNNPDATVYDLASEYIRDMANILEIDPNQIKLSDVEKAIAFVGPDGKQRTLAGWEWKKMLREDPRFQYTTTARGEASSMATAFARSFGVSI
jgi:hypothetical protein